MWWINFLRLARSTQPQAASDWLPPSWFEPLDAVELEAEVVDTIAPYKTGQVYWRATFWNAREITEETLNPGDIVHVLGYRHNLLWVRLILRTSSPPPEPTRSILNLSHPPQSLPLLEGQSVAASTPSNLLN